MDNIAFGQYVPGNSWIYKLDPRVKIVLTIALIVIIFLIPNLLGMAIALGVFILVFLSTRISIFKVFGGLKAVMFMLLFTFLLQVIYTKGTADTLWYQFNMQIGLFQILIMAGILLVYFFTKKYVPIKFIYMLVAFGSCFITMWLFKSDICKITDFNLDVYKEGVSKGTFVFVRIVLMIGITSLLTLSTMSLDINNGLEAVLSPLKLIKVPVGVFSMLISLTLRFIPTLLNESKKIMNAQASRGVDFKEGRLLQKVNQIVSLLIPMFVISFKKAEDLSNAMEARGYIIGAKRTNLVKLELKWRDYVVILSTLAILGVVIWSMIYVQV